MVDRDRYMMTILLPVLRRTGAEYAVLPLLICFLVSAFGCGPGYGTVMGTVTYQGKPLTTGFVGMFHPDGRQASGQVQKDGTYTIPGAPAGSVVVIVDSTPPIPVRIIGGTAKKENTDQTGEAKNTALSSPSGQHVAIPKKYGNPAESGLSYTVRVGEQTHDVVLP